jgi:fibronectin-binding autotransporter adhesin
MKPKSTFKFVATAALVAASSAHAATTDTWVGNTSTAWATGTNWSPSAVPLTGDSFIFGAAGSSGTALNNNLAVGFNVAGITFNSGASAYTVTGNSFNLTGNITNNSTSLQTFNNPLTLSAAAHTITTTTGGGNITLGPGSINGNTGSLIIAGTGTTTLTAPTDAAWTLPATTSVSNGATLKLQFQTPPTTARNNSIGTITLGSSGSVLELAATSTVVDRTPIVVSGSSILGSGIINKTGGGYVPIFNDSIATSFSGQINIVAGVLGANSSNGWSNAKLDVASGAAFDVRNGTLTSVGELTGAGRIGTTFSGARIFTVGNLGTSTAFSGVIENTLTPTGFTLTNITSGGTLGLTKTGSGILTLSGANTYTGGTNVNAGALSLLNTTAKPASGTITVAAGATLGLGVSGGSAFTSGNVDSLFTNTLTNVSMNATSLVGIDTTNGNFTYGTSVASTTRGLNKLGTNTLTLTGTNSYTGATTVSAGKLVINGSISTSVLTTVNSGATLGGTGTVGPLTVASGGILAPGDGGIESLNTGALTLAGISNFEINTSGDAADLAIASALLTFGGTLNVANIGGTLQNGDVFDLFDWGTKTGTFATVNLPDITPLGLSWDQSNLYTNGTIAIIPEPNIAALLGAFGLLGLLRRRRA